MLLYSAWYAVGFINDLLSHEDTIITSDLLHRRIFLSFGVSSYIMT